MCGGGCGGCENMVLKYLGFDCETAIAGDYVIRVTKDNCGCSASLVLMPDVPTGPDAVTSLTSVLSSGTCGNPVLSWTGSALASSYDIYEGATLITNTTLTTYTISGASAGSHTYTVYAKNAVGISQGVNTIIVVVTCATAPNPVTNVSVTDAGGGAYDCGDPIITWVASTTPGAIYTIKEGAAIIASGLSTTSYTISGATIGNHTYTVEAYNGVGSSAGVSVSVSVVSCLSAPGNVTGTINVYDSGTMVNYTCGTGFDVDFTDVATATYYQLFEGAAQIGSNSSTSNFVVTGQSVGSHTYTIKACNGAGCSTGTNFTVNIINCGPLIITTRPSSLQLDGESVNGQTGTPATVTMPGNIHTGAVNYSGLFGTMIPLSVYYFVEDWGVNMTLTSSQTLWYEDGPSGLGINTSGYNMSWDIYGQIDGGTPFLMGSTPVIAQGDNITLPGYGLTGQSIISNFRTYMVEASGYPSNWSILMAGFHGGVLYKFP